jgi:hypothetical protein
MLVAGSALSTPLVAQSAAAVGVAATVGGSWQIESIDLGYVQGVHAGPLRSLSVGGRFGAFVNEGAVFGGAQGFVAALLLQARTGLVRLADVGSETNPSSFGLDLTFEAAGYGAVNAPANTPLSQLGSAWGAVSVLPGLRFGDPETVRYGLVLGPTVLFGHTTEVRAFLGLRVELPLVHRKRQP